MNKTTENKLMKLLFESDENPVVSSGGEDRFHLEDCIQYVTKPGIIVATIRGSGKYGIRQLPIGAVDSFRFMKITDDSAILEQEKNNGKSYDSIMEEYEKEKVGILDMWIRGNANKLRSIESKYGKTLLGLDIMQNDKKFNPQETDEEHNGGDEIVGEENARQENSNNAEASGENRKTDEKTTENAQKRDDNKEMKTASKDIAQFLKDNEDKIYEISDEKMDKLRDDPKNKDFFSKVEEIQKKYVGDKTPDQIDKATQSKIMKELYKIEKDEPQELKDYKPEDFKKDGLKDVDKYQNAISVMQKKKQEDKQKSKDGSGAQQINEEFMGIFGLILSGLQGLFNLAWSAISLIFAHPMAAGSLCLLFYIIGKNRKK